MRRHNCYDTNVARLIFENTNQKGGGEERARSERASEIRKLRQTYTTLKAKERRKIQILQSKLMI